MKEVIKVDLNLTDTQRKIIYDLCAGAIIDGVEAGRLSEDEEKKSAEYVLQLDSVTTRSGLKWFLESLSGRWPIYAHVYQQFVLKDIGNWTAEDKLKLLHFRTKDSPWF